jgi:hypothetical protein
MQVLLCNAFANKHVPKEPEYNNKRCFLCRDVITKMGLEVRQIYNRVS